MKNSGPNSPQTIRGLLNRRSLRGIMDTRWQQEADIVTAPMGNPFGKGFHELKTPSGTHYVVGDQTGGRTFAPDTEVMVAIPQGRHNKAVIGGAPLNKKGGGARNTSRRRRGTVTLESNQYAFGQDADSNLVATLYADGTYVSTRATIAPFGDTFTGCILSDSSALVGVGSLLMRGTGALYVWDAEGAATYSYTVPAGWVNPTPAYYQNGFLYWCEVEDIPQAGVGVGDATFDYRLRRSATDLTSVTTIATVTSADASVYGAPYTVYDHPPEPWAFAVDADGAILYLGFIVAETTNYEFTTWFGLQARFALSGGAPSTRAWTIDEFRSSAGETAPGVGGFPCATIGTASFAICGELGEGRAVSSKGDNASTAAANLWPADGLGAVSPVSMNVGTGGSVVQVYGSQTILRGVAAGTEITNAVEAFDDTPNYPTVMFYFGI